LVRFPAARDPAVVGEQDGVRRIVARESGKAVEHLRDGKGVANEIQQLGCEQIDDLCLDVYVAAVEFGEQALRVRFDVGLVLVKQRLKI
jgi:hypothetical protein